jgi:hypothetical protein
MDSRPSLSLDFVERNAQPIAPHLDAQRASYDLTKSPARGMSGRGRSEETLWSVNLTSLTLSQLSVVAP